MLQSRNSRFLNAEALDFPADAARVSHMGALDHLSGRIAAVLLGVVLGSGLNGSGLNGSGATLIAPAFAEGVAADGVEAEAALLAELADPENRAWRRTERALLARWSLSGSPAMDLLLERGRRAMAEGEFDAAIEHLTALTDHAPDFAEGWNARATAFYMAGQFGPSIADIARTLALNPAHFGALAGLGHIFRALDEPERALAAYRAALAIHPNKPELREAVETLEAALGGQDI
ncbi:MAG: tetratricopeptide repeat protein [Gemmobacter sp.]|jgi:tetratricopeptide (TPR) repeat protein